MNINNYVGTSNTYDVLINKSIILSHLIISEL